MSRLNPTAAAYVDANQYIRPVHFIFMDFLGDPLRACDAGMTIILSGTGIPGADGTYLGLTGDIAQLSPITVGEGGSETVTAKLSGLKTIDDDTMDLFGDRTKWKGRTAQVFRAVWNQANANQGALEHIYTGYMVDSLFGGSVESQFIEVTIESYLAAYSQPSNRDYLNSTLFDPGDQSGKASISLANGDSQSHPGSLPVGSSGPSSWGATFRSGLGPGGMQIV